jgi:hypothetical protein
MKRRFSHADTLDQGLVGCTYEQTLCWGDRRPDLTSRHHAAEEARQLQATSARTLRVRTGRASQHVLEKAVGAIERLWGSSS